LVSVLARKIPEIVSLIGIREVRRFAAGDGVGVPDDDQRFGGLLHCGADERFAAARSIFEDDQRNPLFRHSIPKGWRLQALATSRNFRTEFMPSSRA
jgi:hypothetical protein